MNPILRYLKQTGLTQAQLSRMTDISAVQLSLWSRGKRKPSIEQAVKLEKGTLGSIPVNAWAKSKRAA